MNLRLQICLLWVTLAAFGGEPPLPPGHLENPDAWLYQLGWPKFSTQSPKGNEQDPLATIPAGKSAPTFSSLPAGRLSLRITLMDIPSIPVQNPAYQVPTKAVDFALGTPTRKLVWTGTYFTNTVQDGATLYCDRVVLLEWNQETNQLSEVFYSSDLKNWESLQDVQYTGQWWFSSADCLTIGRRFYRLQVR